MYAKLQPVHLLRYWRNFGLHLTCRRLHESYYQTTDLNTLWVTPSGNKQGSSIQLLIRKYNWREELSVKLRSDGIPFQVQHHSTPRDVVNYKWWKCSPTRLQIMVSCRNSRQKGSLWGNMCTCKGRIGLPTVGTDPQRRPLLSFRYSI